MKLLKPLNIAHTLGIVWLISLLVFLGALISGVGKGELSKEGVYLVVSFLTGLFAFLGASVLYLVHYMFLRKKAVLGTTGSIRGGVSTVVYVMVGVILALIGVFSVRGAYFLGKASKNVEQPQPVTQTTPTSAVQVKYVDSDPVITCTSSHSQCSGQSIQARKSQCSNIYCCQVGDKWSVYPSESECLAAQPKKETKPTSYPPCTINYSDLGAITYYSIPPEECASKQMEARTNDVLRESYDSCVKNFGAENCQ